jgi:hypothetical protein
MSIAGAGDCGFASRWVHMWSALSGSFWMVMRVTLTPAAA